jgi:hypothetical protein
MNHDLKIHQKSSKIHKNHQRAIKKHRLEVFPTINLVYKIDRGAFLLEVGIEMICVMV